MSWWNKFKRRKKNQDKDEGVYITDLSWMDYSTYGHEVEDDDDKDEYETHEVDDISISTEAIVSIDSADTVTGEVNYDILEDDRGRQFTVNSKGVWQKIQAEDTDSMFEGATNLFYTDARARAAVSVSGDLSYNATTGVISTQGLASSTTDDLAEGAGNQYYTDARARGAISVSGSLSYDQTSGAISYTQGSTDTVSEGSTNLYYTDARVGSYLTANNYATDSDVSTAIANLVDTAPTTLNTLNELAAALGDDPNFASTMTTSLATKLDSSSYTAADVLSKVKTVDGAGSGLDADTLDGVQAATFAQYYEGTTAPAVTTNGTMWYDTSDDILYQRQNGAWVQISTSAAPAIVVYDVNGVIVN